MSERQLARHQTDTQGRETMSKYEDHVCQSLDGQSGGPGDEPDSDAMRWAPAPVDGDATTEAIQTAADAAHALLGHAADAYVSLVNDVLGDGTHHMVASASTRHRRFAECQELMVTEDCLVVDDAASVRLCAVIAAAMVGGGTGGLVVRTFALDGREFVRGWRIRGRWLRPLTAREIREAYTVNPETGAPMEPEPGVEYRQAERVPLPLQAPTGGASASPAPRDNRPPNRRG
ncbi:hypothetical protein [Streptomyces sp. CAS3]